MRLPRWLARFNRKVTNRILIRLAKRPPYCALRHTGRSSGVEHRTPLNSFPDGHRFVFALTYGPSADWVQNVLSSGTAVLEYGNDEIQLTSPRLISKAEAWPVLPRIARLALGVLRTRDFLAMDAHARSQDRP
ncbi:MAG: nitroreductase family deazaflavin-dependent oxidoreductase [Acidimicrobiia bacterium]|nr:nitroreductase family deazaflavin-dependent oxidoreductase [Acidimicrobiia bacterium]